MNDNTQNGKSDLEMQAKLAALNAAANHVELAIREMHRVLKDIARSSPGLLEIIRSRLERGDCR